MSNPTEQKVSGPAMRAAEEIKREIPLTTFAPDGFPKEPDTEQIATIIDRETGVKELREALKRIAVGDLGAYDATRVAREALRNAERK